MLLIVPADPLRARRPDPHFAPEHAAARDAGWDAAVVDHDALVQGDTEAALARVPAGAGPAVYRGWMVRSARYEAFEAALAARGTRLRTSAAQYRRAHELPGWYAALAAVTPESVWTSGPDRGAFDAARERLGPGPAVLRDHVKSMKHYWDEAVYIPDLADADAAWAVARRFLELRADDLVGGLVLRRFEPLRGPELRTWWVDGRCRLAGPHPDTADAVPDGEPPDADVLAPLVAGLGLPFVTVDLSRRADGVWRVVELGDGQVSDRPRTVEAADLIAALA